MVNANVPINLHFHRTYKNRFNVVKNASSDIRIKPVMLMIPSVITVSRFVVQARRVGGWFWNASYFERFNRTL